MVDWLSIGWKLGRCLLSRRPLKGEGFEEMFGDPLVVSRKTRDRLEVSPPFRRPRNRASTGNGGLLM